MAPDTLRLAAFQRRARFADATGVAESILADLCRCSDEGVNLALFPECYLQGYVLDRATLAEHAIDPRKDAGFQNLLAQSASSRVTFVVGLIERSDRSIFNSVAVIHSGRIVGIYRKTRLHRKEMAFDAGEGCSVFEFGDWPFGINICYEANFSDLARNVVDQGARLLCYPINNMLPVGVADRWRQKSVDNLRHRAIETGCWIASADVVGSHSTQLSYGCTCIVAPDGTVVAHVEEGHEGVVLFDLH